MTTRIGRSLTLKWMVFSILLATIPLAIAGFSIIQIYQDHLKKSVITIEKEKANMVVEKTRSFFEKITSNLHSLSIDEHFREGSSPGHIKSLLESFLYQNDYLSELTLLNEKGEETIKVSKYKVFKPSDLKDQSKTEIFRVASNLRTYYGGFKLTEGIVPTMVIAVPIGESRRRPTDVLSAEIHLRYLWNLIPQIQIGGKGTTYVVDGEGDLIAHLDTTRVTSRINVRHLPMVDRAVAGEEGNLEFEDSGGEKSLVVYKPIKELGWGVIVQVPIEEAYAPLRQVANTALKWILIALIVAIIFSLLLTKRLSHPIKRLSAQMAKVSEGSLDVHISPTTKDEVGVLTESFNQMIQDLKLSHEALKKAEEKYRRIFEDSKDLFFITSAEGNFLEVNQAGVDMLGYESKEELFKFPVRDTYLNPADRDIFTKAMENGFVKDFEAKLKRKDGTPIDVLVTASAKTDGSGEIISYEGVVKNISDRKRMEEELLRRTEELQALYDLSILINQSLELDTVLHTALEKALSVTGFEIGTIHLLKEDGETLELKYHIGPSDILDENIKYFKIGEGVAGKAVQFKRPMTFSIDEYPTPRIIPILREKGIQSLVGIPLLAKNEAIGSLTLTSRSIHQFTQREINLLESIGNQIGLALENAKLFSAVDKAKSEWETTFNAVTDLITIRDKDYRIIRANKAAFKRFGLKSEEMIGKRCFETLHHSEKPCEGCYVTEALKTKKPASGERESKYLNGIFQYYTYPVYDEIGEVIGVADLAREITEQKRLEMEKEVINNINKILASNLDVRQGIQAACAELKKALSSERLSIALFDEEGEGFRYFALEKDYDAEELVEGISYPRKGSHYQIIAETGMPIIVPEVMETDSWIGPKLLKEGIRSSLIFPLEYKGKIIGTVNFGSNKPNHFSEAQFNLLRQIAPGLAISIQNVLLFEEIRRSEERYRTVIEGTLDGVCVIDIDYRFKYVNEKLAEIQGYSREELIGKDFRDYINEESKALLADRDEQRKRGIKLSPHFELNIIRKDGGVRNAEISARAIKDSKGKVNIIVILKDITEKKRMEEQLLQNEKLRALGEMASGVAHDFNNALAAILGNTQLLLYTAKDEELKESLKIIEKVARDSAQTVRRLQDFTRKRVHQELYKFNVNAIIQDAIEITKPKWKDEVQGKGIHIEMVTNFDEVPLGLGNTSEMREVIANMIFNAIEAMPEGGKIEIQTFQRKSNIYIQISDTGIGMTEEVRKKVFEPFFTTKPFSNTGLGLSMSYGIIKRLGGEIEVESKVGKGTTFTIILPVGLEGK